MLCDGGCSAADIAGLHPLVRNRAPGARRGPARPAGASRGVGGRVSGEIMARIFTETIHHIVHLAAEGKISMDTEIVPLQDIEKAWLQKDAAGRRLVAVP